MRYKDSIFLYFCPLKNSFYAKDIKFAFLPPGYSDD